MDGGVKIVDALSTFSTVFDWSREMAWMPVLLALLLVLLPMYVIYYLFNAVGPPRIVTSNKKFNDFMTQHCPILYQTYWPTFWAVNSHVQTMGRVVIQFWRSVATNRETLRLSDGGHICLDWCNEEDDVPNAVSRRPTVLILPGISGSSYENYISNFLYDMMECNYRSVVFNYRGCGNTGLSTPLMYCAGNITDLTEVICHIKQCYPNSPLMAVGTSLGGIQIICYLKECYLLRRDPHLVAALTISVPWNLHTAATTLHRPINRFTINAFLSYKIKLILKQNQDVFLSQKNLSFSYHTALKCYCFQELEMHLTRPMFGFKDVVPLRDYGSPHNKVSGITIPLLCLNSVDDPMCPKSAIPEDDILSNKHVMLALTSKGGHVAFMQGGLPFGKTLMDHTLIQFSKAVFSHRDELQDVTS